MPLIPLRKRPGSSTRSNEDWVSALRGGEDPAVEELRDILVRCIAHVVKRSAPGHASAFVEDLAQDALLLILDKLDTYRGEARFTTWCQKVAVRTTLTELRRFRWKDTPMSLMEFRDVPALSEPDPFEQVATSFRQRVMSELIRTELTAKQRDALETVMIQGMPLEEAARRMETNRNALYKLLFDARVRLKTALLKRGIDAEDLLDEN